MYRSIRSTQKKGFTLVEILIVVIIIGILAAIVIPQFSSASEDARKGSLASQLQALRSQVALYRLEHGDEYPTADGKVASAWSWDLLTKRTDKDGTLNEAAGKLGPYLQSEPVNALNDKNGVGTDLGADNGFVIDSKGKLFATGKDPAAQWFDEKSQDELAGKPTEFADAAQ